MPLKLKPKYQLPSSPLLTVYFSGLLIVNPLTDAVCEIGVHHDTTSAEPRKHHLKIRLKVTLADHGVINVPIHAGPLEQPFRIKVFNPVDSTIGAYYKQGAFRRDPGRDDGRDLRWALNLEGEEFHRGDLSSDSAELKPVVRVENGGVFFTSERTDPSIFGITRYLGASNPASGVPMDSIANVIGVGIDVAERGTIELSGFKGSPQTLTLPRPIDKDGSTYELFITNRPIGEMMPEPDELAHYYEVLKKSGGANIPDPEKWHVHIELLGQFFEDMDATKRPKKTDEIPCMPIIRNGME